MSVWWIAVALLNAPGGRIADELSHKTGLVFGLTVALVGVLVLLNASVYVLLVLGIAVVGVGRGFYQPSAIGQISDLFVNRRAQALGLRGAAFNFGGVVAGFLVAGVLAVATWQATFVPIVLGLCVVIGLMHVLNREPYEIKPVQLNIRETLARLKHSQNIVLVIIALSLFGFSWTGSLTFLPSFLQFEKGFSPTLASVAYSGIFVVGVVVQPLYGRVGDRHGHARAAFGAVSLCTIGLAGILLANQFVLLAVSIFVFAIGLAAFWPVMMAFGLERLSSRSRAGDWGAITAIFLSVEALGSVYVGIAIDLTSYTIALGSLLVVLSVTVAITLWLATVG